MCVEKMTGEVWYFGEREDLAAAYKIFGNAKDIRLMIEAAGREPLTVLPALAARMDEAIARGYGRDDMGAIAADALQVSR